MKNKKTILKLGVLVATASPIAIIVSCQPWDKPEILSSYNLNEMNEKKWHSLFHVSGRSLPKDGTVFEIEVNSKKYKYTWTSADTNAKIPKDFLAKKVSQIDLINYLIVRISGSQDQQVAQDFLNVFGIGGHNVKPKKVDVRIGSDSNNSPLNRKTFNVEGSKSIATVIEDIAKNAKPKDVVFINGNPTGQGIGDLTQEKINNVKKITSKTAYELMKALGFKRIIKDKNGKTTFLFDIYLYINKVIRFVMKTEAKAGDIIKFDPMDFVKNFSYVQYSKNLAKGKQQISYTDFIKLFSKTLTTQDITKIKAAKTDAQLKQAIPKILAAMKWVTRGYDPTKDVAPKG